MDGPRRSGGSQTTSPPLRGKRGLAQNTPLGKRPGNPSSEASTKPVPRGRSKSLRSLSPERFKQPVPETPRSRISSLSLDPSSHQLDPGNSC